MLPHIGPQHFDEASFSLLFQEESLRQFDTDLVLQIDQKVAEQQQTLESAGVPGFRVTNSPTEIKVQMHLVDFIRRLNPNLQ